MNLLLRILMITSALSTTAWMFPGRAAETAAPPSKYAIRMVDDILASVPELRNPGRGGLLLRDDPLFHALEGEFDRLAAASVKVHVHFNEVADTKLFGVGVYGTCAPLPDGPSTITLYTGNMRNEAPEDSGDRFELFWFVLLHEMGNARQRVAFLELYDQITKGQISREEYIKRCIAREIESSNKAFAYLKGISTYRNQPAGAYSYVRSDLERRYHQTVSQVVERFYRINWGDYYREMCRQLKYPDVRGEAKGVDSR